MPDLLVRDVRLVALDAPLPEQAPVPGEPVDVLVRDGAIIAVGEGVRERVEALGIPVLDGKGRHAVPGLWDMHVHMVQWGLSRTRLDTSGTSGPQEVLGLVAARLAGGLDTPTGMLVGYGHRTGSWDERPTVAALDAVTGEVPVALIAGDAHHGWLNTAALRLVGGPMVTGVVSEGAWFPLYDRLQRLQGAAQEAEFGVAQAVAAAHARGIVGIVDLEFGQPWLQWRARTAGETPPLRARTAVYPEGLDAVIAAGVRTGDPIRATDGLVTMGPLKVITDGSLNTRTAWCCQPYADAAEPDLAHGAPNLPADELVELLQRAHDAGLEAALHAIGDAAVSTVLDAFTATGAGGSVEHAQLVDLTDLQRWSRLPVRASVQPAHLLDDRTVTEQCWPERTHRTFVLRGFLDAGIELAFGSDAPVSPLDPWLAMAAAVHRGAEGEESWHPEQQISPREALAASVDGRRIRAGAPGDLVLLDIDPLGADGPQSTSAEQAARLRKMTVSATVLDGQVVHEA
ncbi:amidohydrolase [Ornithinimicrobium pratense]|uniref:Amidohydrolase family protein n=1 Tax=Ornithinimicrobium pratense TaxID=2593973 RepID=A0A5J6V3F6_9MICO|nr:amidohydrolase family protein [Ornithinimicrobium pratense]QFG67844.1 amidohydrolase family protein [Ornithinimicrobium pratense]